ncbi:hypothetical protein EVAR_34198_1 [Eumeta japonica]|uniref:Uncharacterized protein n=1 Tax=Eumeta variegata TaxID=151549 RepID=A0A4C1WIK9_EUMVA|nr:hypothetical protein EVAR_34198_1 [Eumeta japonica]
MRRYNSPWPFFPAFPFYASATLPRLTSQRQSFVRCNKNNQERKSSGRGRETNPFLRHHEVKKKTGSFKKGVAVTSEYTEIQVRSADLRHLTKFCRKPIAGPQTADSVLPNSLLNGSSGRPRPRRRRRRAACIIPLTLYNHRPRCLLDRAARAGRAILLRKRNNLITVIYDSSLTRTTSTHASFASDTIEFRSVCNDSIHDVLNSKSFIDSDAVVVGVGARLRRGSQGRWFAVRAEIKRREQKWASAFTSSRRRRETKGSNGICIEKKNKKIQACRKSATHARAGAPRHARRGGSDGAETGRRSIEGAVTHFRDLAAAAAAGRAIHARPPCPAAAAPPASFEHPRESIPSENQLA